MRNLIFLTNRAHLSHEPNRTCDKLITQLLKVYDGFRQVFVSQSVEDASEARLHPCTTNQRKPKSKIVIIVVCSTTPTGFEEKDPEKVYEAANICAAFARKRTFEPDATLQQSYAYTRVRVLEGG